MEPATPPTPPRDNGDLSFSQVVLILAIVVALSAGALDIIYFVKGRPIDVRAVAVRCAWITVISLVVAVICGLLQFRRRTPDPAAPAPGADAPPDSLSASRVVLGCIAGIVVVGGVFAWLDRGSDGLVFIGVGVILVPVMLVWKARRFRWRQ